MCQLVQLVDREKQVVWKIKESLWSSFLEKRKTHLSYSRCPSLTFCVLQQFIFQTKRFLLYFWSLKPFWNINVTNYNRSHDCGVQRMSYVSPSYPCISIFPHSGQKKTVISVRGNVINKILNEGQWNIWKIHCLSLLYHILTHLF